MNFNLNSFLISISTALDMAESEIMNLNINHSRRVAYISLRIAEVLDISKEERFDLCSLAIMHDNGLTEAALKHNLYDIPCTLKALEDLKDHCNIGEKNIENYPFLSEQKNIILFHHENYDGSGFFGKKGDEIPLLSQIIAFADSLDFRFDICDYSLENKKEVHRFVKENENILHSKRLAEAFYVLEENTAFWLDMQNMTIDNALIKYIPEFTIDISLEKLLECAKVFSKIIDAKSSFTAVHTDGLIEKSKKMAEFYNFDKDRTLKFEIAASLHDLGKLAVPNRILDKEMELTNDEYETIKIHTYFTNFMLENIEGFSDINSWAFKHHEKLDGSGYPYGIEGKDLGFEERLMGCLDIYQALREDRPYREGLSHEESIAILIGYAKKGLIDKDIVNDIYEVFK